MNKKNLIKTVFVMCLMALPLGANAQVLKGDVNEDGKFNISDVTTLINWLLGGVPETSSDKIFTVNGVSFKMLAVEGGTFTMGATEEQVLAGAEGNEYPAHQVTLSSYYIGETEVTQELWVAVMGTNPSSNQSDLKNPVENVTWNDCQTFINQLNALTGMTFRLPTEAEWEYAARGGNKAQGFLYSGNSNIDEVAWYNGNSGGYTHPVAEKQANELGLYDMSGNVFEWVQDWFGSYSDEAQTDPTGPLTGDHNIVRGGSCGGAHGPMHSRVSFRMGMSLGVHFGDSGFRLALSFQ